MFSYVYVCVWNFFFLLLSNTQNNSKNFILLISRRTYQFPKNFCKLLVYLLLCRSLFFFLFFCLLKQICQCFCLTFQLFINHRFLLTLLNSQKWDFILSLLFSQNINISIQIADIFIWVKQFFLVFVVVVFFSSGVGGKFNIFFLMW